MKNRNREQDKPVIRSTIDRRQLLLGSLTLLCMAALLIVGLTPRTVSAPDAEQPAAQAGVDTAALLREDCQLIQHMTYAPCGHELTRRMALPAELVGKGRADLEAAYDLWQVTGYSPTEVTMEQALNLYCPEHLVLMPDESGMLCIFRNTYGDALGLVSELDIPLAELPDAVQEELRPGKGFSTQEELDAWLEAAES
ncbi:MAG: hypothetical protein ACI4O7_09265 [Aristaeellaceae bacterium]